MAPDAARRRSAPALPAARRRRRDPHRLPGRRGPRRTPASTYAFRFDIERDARRDGRRRAGRRLEQLAVPVVPLPGVARRRVQRVPLQLLQVAVGRADAPHRGRGACAGSTRRRRPSPTSSSATGSSSAAARTATPTSRVRRGRRLRADVHAARLALRPRDRPLPHRRRPPLSIRERRPRAAGRCSRDVGRRGDAGSGRSRPGHDRADELPWTQTGMPIGIRPVSQMKSIAGTVTRTQPCDAG